MALIHGIIYKLSDDEGYYYYGSTIQTLRERFGLHKFDSKKTKSKLYQQFTYEKFCQNRITIKVIEEVVVKNQRELQKTEDLYIQWCRNDLKLLNSVREYITEEESKYKEQRQKYRNDHRQEINHHAKKYYDKNKERINEKYKERIICDCGVMSENMTMHDIKNHNFIRISSQTIINWL